MRTDSSRSTRSSRRFSLLNVGGDSGSDAASSDASGSLFHIPQFIEQFLVQLLVPLSVVYLVVGYGYAAAANVLSVPRPFSCTFAFIFATAQLISMMPLLVLVAWVLRGSESNSDNFDAATAVLRVDVAAICATLVMHRLAISIKYAFQPRATYARRMRFWVTYQERLDDQLFASWFSLTRATIEREVSAALKMLDEGESSATLEISRVSLDRLRGAIHVSAHADLSAYSAANEDDQRKDAHGTLPVSALVTALLIHVNEVTSGHVTTLKRITFFVGIISLFCTTILRAALGLPIVGSSPVEASIIAGTWVSNFLLLPTIFTFLAVGIVDHARRESALDALSSLYRTTPLDTAGGRGGSSVGMLASASDVHPPVLPLEQLAHVRAFLAARSLLLAFGASFHSRLVTVISSDLIVIVILAAFCIFTALTAPLSKGLAPVIAPLVLFHSLVVPSVALCALGLYMAARANTAAAYSASIIAQTRLYLRITGAVPPPMLTLLSDVELLLRENAVPITVLGIAATPALTQALMGGFFSLETLLISGVVTRINTNSLAAATASSTALPPSPSQLPNDGRTTPTPSASPFIATEPSSPTASSTSSLGALVGYFFAALTLVALIAALVVAVASHRKRMRTNSPSPASPRAATATTTSGDGTTSHKNPLSAAETHPPTKGVAAEGEELTSPPAETPAREGQVKNISVSLPAGWVRHTEEAGGGVWYHNVVTGETSWDDPSLEVKPLPAGWVRHTEVEEGGGGGAMVVWYHNSATGETSWVEPK